MLGSQSENPSKDSNKLGKRKTKDTDFGFFRSCSDELADPFRT